MSTRVTSKGQVTIPAEIRAVAHADAGTELDWSYDPIGERIIATRTGSRPSASTSRFARFRGSATTGLTTDEIMALTRDMPEA
jgi:AbrB family looped-hinge helix DNA binding protein